VITAELQEMMARLAPNLPALDNPRVQMLVEAQADQFPGHAGLRQVSQALGEFSAAAHGLSPVVGGVLRDRLIRWDHWTTTWEGTDALTGRRAQVRVLRPWAAREPAWRRCLIRDGRALLAVLPDLRVDVDTGTLVVPLPGPAFTAHANGGHATHEALVRLTTTTIHHLRRWWAYGLGHGRLAPEELADAGTHISVVTLTPQAGEDAGQVIAWIAGMLLAWWGQHDVDRDSSPFADMLQGLVTLPPRRVEDAAQSCLNTLSETLADELHGLTRRARDLSHADERARLLGLVRRLAVACIPPRGRAAVGVDLEGRTLVVQCYDDTVWWGPVGEDPEPLWSDASGLDLQLARRLLRTRGSAPVNERLNRDVDGTPAYVDRITRWTSAQVELRTLRLLLQRHAAA
jgi:hypothetical protein